MMKILSSRSSCEIDEAQCKKLVQVQAELDKFGKDGRGYETRPGRTPKETLEENIMVMLDLGKQAAGDVAKMNSTSRVQLKRCCWNGDIWCPWFYGQPDYDGR
jgi:hypothetical protein